MILAIDPGKMKCGLAVLGMGCEVLEKNVIERANLSAEVDHLLTKYQIDKLVIGDSASGRAVKKELDRFKLGLEPIFVSEKDSTWQARQRYWRANPPTGWLRFVPTSLRVPPKPVDDWAAVVLGERGLAD